MLTIEGGRHSDRFCDGLSRRDFLKVGGLAMGGMSLPQLLAAEAQAGIKSSHKAIIMVFLCGGPPHQDMFDLKPDAPSEIRGEFKPIPTNLDGVQICELMPRLAKMMDKCAIVRSLIGARDEHAAHLCMSGYTTFEFIRGNWPSLGSTVARLKGPTEPTVPPFVGLSPQMDFSGWANPGDAGFLGEAYKPFLPRRGQVAKDMELKRITLDRLNDRRKLLSSLDTFRREADASVEGSGVITQNAMDLLTSNKVAQALDLDKEDQKLRDRYGRGNLKNVDDGGPMWNDGLLIARRLVETGVRVVTLGYGRWDYHGKNFQQCRERLPMLDQGVSALIQDIHDRGMDKDVSVVVWGDFGRTPRINKDGGRDHWAPVSCALLAGGGMRTGQVLGSTTPDGGYADQRPIHYKDVMATLYRNMGIDVRQATLPGPGDRPFYLLEGHGPVEELS
jgi:hypothetical protein